MKEEMKIFNIFMSKNYFLETIYFAIMSKILTTWETK